tara:strand:+ start:144 stop:737 length:594 start_codon:yes stop_codon:yes gene_type:complete
LPKVGKKKIYIWIFFFLILFIFLFYLFKKTKIDTNITDNNDITDNNVEEKIYSSNVIENVNYSSIDIKGNEYIINAAKGEIDYKNNDVIYLTNVEALIKLNNANNIKITSDYGKYNTFNFDTIFSKNVVVTYLTNTIKSEYLDNSISRNSLIISKNVIYTDNKNILYADVIEMNIETKDTKIFMYENEKKVNIQSKN